MVCAGLAGGTIPCGAVTDAANTGLIGDAGAFWGSAGVVRTPDVARAPTGDDSTRVPASPATSEASRREPAASLRRAAGRRGSGGEVGESKRFTECMYRTTGRGH